MNGVGFVSSASSRGALALLFPTTSPASRLPHVAAAVSFFQATANTGRAHSTRSASSWTARVGHDEASGPASVPSESPSRLQDLIRAAKAAASFSRPRALESVPDRSQAPWQTAAAAAAPSSLACYSDLLSGHAALSRASRSAPPAAKRPSKQRAGGPTRPPTPSQPPRKKATPPPPTPPPEDPPPPAPPPHQSTASPMPPPPASQPLPYVPQPSAGAPQGRYDGPDTGSRQSVSPGSLSWFVSQTDRLPTPALIYGLIGLNVLIFLCWQYAMNSTATKQGDPTWPLLMFDNFIHSQRNWDAGRWWNVLSATFSHAVPQHLAMNMLSVALLGPALATKVGSAYFLGVYLLGGIAGSVASSLNFLYLEPELHPKKKRPDASGSGSGSGGYSTLGASGSVFALLATLTFLDPKQGFMFFFVIPCSARLLLAGMTCNELAGLYFGKDLLGQLFAGKVDHAAHLGGMVGGIAFWAWKLRGRGRGGGARMRWK